LERVNKMVDNVSKVIQQKIDKKPFCPNCRWVRVPPLGKDGWHIGQAWCARGHKIFPDECKDEEKGYY